MYGPTLQEDFIRSVFEVLTDSCHTLRIVLLAHLMVFSLVFYENFIRVSSFDKIVCQI